MTRGVGHNRVSKIRQGVSTNGLSTLVAGVDPLGNTDQEAYWHRARIADEVFQSAMTRAIGVGDEHAPIGVHVDARPLPATTVRFARPSISGGCSSPAQECAEMGGVR